jgi:hypothetical protein
VGLTSIDRIIMAVYSFLQSLIPRPACLSSIRTTVHISTTISPLPTCMQDCPVEVMQISSSFRLILAFGNMDE